MKLLDKARPFARKVYKVLIVLTIIGAICSLFAWGISPAISGWALPLICIFWTMNIEHIDISSICSSLYSPNFTKTIVNDYVTNQLNDRLSELDFKYRQNYYDSFDELIRKRTIRLENVEQICFNYLWHDLENIDWDTDNLTIDYTVSRYTNMQRSFSTCLKLCLKSKTYQKISARYIILCLIVAIIGAIPSLSLLDFVTMMMPYSISLAIVFILIFYLVVAPSCIQKDKFVNYQSYKPTVQELENAVQGFYACHESNGIDTMIQQWTQFLQEKINYFSHEDLFFKETHNKIVDYHFVLRPNANDTLMPNPYYYQYISEDTPDYTDTDYDGSYADYLITSHPDWKDKKREINGMGLEFSTFEVIYHLMQRNDTNVKMLSGILVPKLQHNNDVQTALNNGDSNEFDIICISHKGIFVVECKNWHGIIEGNIEEEKMTFKSGDDTREIQNPLWQNYNHIRVLKQPQILGDLLNQYPLNPYFNVVVTGDTLTINHITRPHQKVSKRTPYDEPSELSYRTYEKPSFFYDSQTFWTRYGTLPKVFLDTVSTLPDILSDQLIDDIYNKLIIWRYPKTDDMEAHNSKTNMNQEDWDEAHGLYF